MINNSSARTSPSLLGRLRQDAADERAWSEFVQRYGGQILHWRRKGSCRRRMLRT
jgi:hypothetical protein